MSEASVAIEIVARRLRQQRLTGVPCASADEIVGTLGAVQAQDFAGAKWAIAQRVKGTPVEAELDRWFDAGHVVRTHVLRPTWHLVRPADLRWMLALTAPRVAALLSAYDRKLELTPKRVARGRELMIAALAGGRHLTRDELGEALRRGGLEATGQRLGHIVMHAELRAAICSGPRRGKEFTYALVDERVPAERARSREEALAELAWRYFSSRGPAQPADFAWWSGLTLSDAQAGVAMNRGRLEQATVRGKTVWFAGPVAPAKTSRPSVHLLPNYDEYFVAYKDRRDLVEPAVAEQLARADRQSRSLLGNLIVVDGRVAGTWRRTLEKNEVIVERRLLQKLSAAGRAALDAAVVRYGRFVGRPVRTR